MCSLKHVHEKCRTGLLEQIDVEYLVKLHKGLVLVNILKESTYRTSFTRYATFNADSLCGILDLKLCCNSVSRTVTESLVQCTY